AADNADRLPETASSAGVDRFHDAHVLGEHAMAGVGSGQQRDNLDDAFLSDFRGLPAMRSPHDDVGEIGRIEQSVRPFDERRADLLDEPIEVIDVREIEPALERCSELGVGDLLRFELLPTARVNENPAGKIHLSVGEAAIELVPDEEGEAENEK